MPRTTLPSLPGRLAAAAAASAMMASALTPFAALAQDAEKKPGLPQLDPHVFLPQLFWLAVIFIVLYLLMSRVALPAVGAVIDARARQIEGDLAAAQTARTRAEALAGEVDKSLAAARADAQATLRKALDEVAKTQAQAEHDIAQRLAAQAREAESRIAAAKAAALANVREIAAAATAAAAERLIGAAPDPAEVQRYVAEGAGQLGGA